MHTLQIVWFFLRCSDIHGALLLVADETEPGLVPAEQYRDTIGDWTELGVITVENWSKEDPRLKRGLVIVVKSRHGSN